MDTYGLNFELTNLLDLTYPGTSTQCFSSNQQVDWVTLFSTKSKRDAM